MRRPTDQRDDGSIIERAISRTLPRRVVLKHGLAGLATVMMSRLLPGCDESRGADAGADAGRLDGGFDASSDAGPFEFPARSIPAPTPLRSLIADIGPLGDPDANGVRVPAGFSARILAEAGQPVAGTTYEWHTAPDGASTFATEDGGWIYACNAELPIIGGVGAIRFDADGEIVDAYRILDETNVNCAGGRTPWHTWLSCEETPSGRVHECDPWGEHAAVARPALGVFKHEAATVDPERGHLYLSEDESDGRFYRYVPDGTTPLGRPNLAAGTLEVAVVDASGGVTWETVPDPQVMTGTTPTRMQVPTSTVFRGGEGIWYHEGVVYLSTKGDNHVWAYDVESETMGVLYDGEAMTDPPLRGVDNLAVSCCGDVLVAEDGGTMQIVAILPSGDTIPLMQIVGQTGSEVTGPTFDPSGTRLYFSSQRGGGGGITYEITGPFHEPA